MARAPLLIGTFTWLAIVTVSSAAAAPIGVDFDCPDFDSHAEAQAFYEAEGGPAVDPHGLDADGDGSACEPYFGIDDSSYGGSSSGSFSSDDRDYDPPESDYDDTNAYDEYDSSAGSSPSDVASFWGAVLIIGIPALIIVGLILKVGQFIGIVPEDW